MRTPVDGLCIPQIHAEEPWVLVGCPTVIIMTHHGMLPTIVQPITATLYLGHSVSHVYCMKDSRLPTMYSQKSSTSVHMHDF